MSHHTNSKPFGLALGSAFAASLIAGSVGAMENPFQQAELNSGYMIADSHEGKCGGAKKADEEGKHGSMEKSTTMEGKCGKGKKEETMKDMKEKKSGMEGKCGSNN